MLEYKRFNFSLSRKTAIGIIVGVVVLVLGIGIYAIFSPSQPKFDPVEARKQGEYQGKAMEEFYKAHPPSTARPTARANGS